MLASLHIKNVVLIDDLVIDFDAGFSALTGETGAGKSILLDALGLATGARSDSGLVKKGAEQSSVSAEFTIDKDHIVNAILEEQDLEISDPLILRRTLKADGRSRAFINDQAVSVGLLKSIGEQLIEIHGQFETQGLLDPKTHRDLLDEYAGLSGSTQKYWSVWQEAENTLKAEREKAEKALTEEDFLRTSVEDLDALAPEAGEEQKLVKIRERLMKRDQNLEALNDGYAKAEEIESLVGQCWRSLEKLGEDGAEIMDGFDRLNAELQNISSLIQSLSADYDETEYSLSEIDDRLFALRGQARKHNCEVDGLAKLRDELAASLNLIERQDDILNELEKKASEARKKYIIEAEKLTEKRKASAAKLDTLVQKELPPLKLEKAVFKTEVTDLVEAQWGPGGMDQVRFLVASNPGREPGAINKIASGGELSRFTLALKVIMANVGAAPTFIFDEIDTGIGGATSAAVGERLLQLSKSKQILVVTHAPQVAALADNHLIVIKESGQDNVRTSVVPLQQAQRQEEIARMLAGADITDEARAAAVKLMKTGT